MRQRFRIAVEARGATVLVAPIGEIDIATLDQVQQRLGELKADDERVVLDVRRVTFIDCSGLHLVLDADAASRSDGCDFRLIHGRAHVRRLFELSHVLQRLRFVEPEETDVHLRTDLSARGQLTPAQAPSAAMAAAARASRRWRRARVLG